MRYRVFVAIEASFVPSPYGIAIRNYGQGIDGKTAVNVWDYETEEADLFVAHMNKHADVVRCYALSGIAAIDDEDDFMWKIDHPNYVFPETGPDDETYSWRRTIDNDTCTSPFWPGLHWIPDYDVLRNDPYPGRSQWERWSNQLLRV